MSNNVLGQVLGSVFTNAMAGRARSGPFRSSNIGAGALSALVGSLIGRGLPMSRGRTLGAAGVSSGTAATSASQSSRAFCHRRLGSTATAFAMTASTASEI